MHLALLLVMVLASCASHGSQSTGQPIEPPPHPTPAQTIFYLNTSALSYGVFETEALSVVVDVYNTTPEIFRPLGDISIEDGTGLRTYKVKPGESTIVHSMPAGVKRVIITSGGQLKFNGEKRGVFITRIAFDRAAAQIQQPGPRLVIYGDSIAVGGNVDNPSAEAWPVRLREHYSVFVQGYGYRTLYDDAATPAGRSELVSSISAKEPDYIWLAIGTNDYAFAQWSARAFGAAYVSTLEALHASNPHALVFAQSPILRADEHAANSLDDYLEDYRQQIASACLARSDWCTFVDGTDPAFPQPDELHADGVHLTTTSSTKYAETVLQTITDQ